MSLFVSSLLLTLTLISPLSVRSRESQFFSKVTNNNNNNPDRFSSYYHNSEFEQWPQTKNTDRVFQSGSKIDEDGKFSKSEMKNADHAYSFKDTLFDPMSDSEMRSNNHPFKSHQPEEFEQRSEFINDEESHQPEEFQRQSDFRNSERFSRFQPMEEFEKPIESRMNDEEFNHSEMEKSYKVRKNNNQGEFSWWNEFEKPVQNQFERGYEKSDEMELQKEIEEMEKMEKKKKEEEMAKQWKPERSASRSGSMNEGDGEMNWPVKNNKMKGQEGMSDTRFLENGKYFYDLEKGSRGGYYYENGP